MAIKKYKPYTPSRRFMTVVDYRTALAPAGDPPKRLLVRIPNRAGRNNQGRITAWQRGGGHKKIYRIIDFKRDKHGVPGKVVSVEYDPNRTAFIARVVYRDGDQRYILAPHGIKPGDEVVSGPGSPIKPGNALPLSEIPEGIPIHNLELIPGKGGQLVRAAGSQAVILSKEDRWAHVKLPSGEVRKIDLRCYATIGQVSNPEHDLVVLGKAGRVRWMGRRPNVRGVAMNPVDHPHGGGEGRTKGKIPKTPWGKIAKGKKTRRKGKPSDKLIVKRRK